MTQENQELDPDATLSAQPAEPAVEPVEDTQENDQNVKSALDSEGDAAADYLEELLDIADLDGDIDIEAKNGRVYLSVTAEDGDAAGLESLVGEDGATLDALQDLTRLAALAATGERSRVIIDIAGHRSRRGERLASLVQTVVDTVKETGEPKHLDPMTPYERKQVHDLVADAGLESDSEGEGSRRHVVVRPEA
ncbi:MAG: protein jag [Galactobacter sp.]